MFLIGCFFDTVVDVVFLRSSFTFVLLIFVGELAESILLWFSVLWVSWHGYVILFLRYCSLVLDLHFIQHNHLLLFFLQWFIWRILFLLFLRSEFGCCIGLVMYIGDQIGNKNFWFLLLWFLGLVRINENFFILAIFFFFWKNDSILGSFLLYSSQLICNSSHLIS